MVNEAQKYLFFKLKTTKTIEKKDCYDMYFSISSINSIISLKKSEVPSLKSNFQPTVNVCKDMIDILVFISNRSSAAQNIVSLFG